MFIMLLSFFIILNAISSYDVTKTSPVLNSLSMTFSKEEMIDDIMPGKMLAESAQTQNASALDRIEAAFRSQITAAETKQNRLGTTMFIRMPFDDFKKGMMKSLVIPNASRRTAFLENDRVDFLPMLVSLMETERDTSYTMDMVLNIEEHPAALVADDPKRFAAINRSISQIALKLENSGLPKHQVTAGLKQGKVGYIDLVFRRYLPFNPLGTAADKAQSKDGQGAAQ